MLHEDVCGVGLKGCDFEDEDHAAEDEGLVAGVEGPGIDNENYGLDGESHGVDDESYGLDDQSYGIDDEGHGQGSGSAPKPERSKRVSAFRQPTLTIRTDPKDGMIYIDVPINPPPEPPVQTPPSLEWMAGSLPISPSPYVVPSPVSSPMMSLTVSLPIALPMATSAATISVDEDQFIEVEAQLELYKSILQDHTQRLDAMPPILFAEINKDRPVLALDACAGRVDTRMIDMSWAGYDDHILVQDMLLQQTALQRELHEMRDRVTVLEQERDRRER
nr:hypothetical protein [Tanacetum cinerariifolium]